MQEDDALRLVEEAVKRGSDVESILKDCQEAMAIVGQRYETGDYFLPELIMSGEILKKISDIVKPQLGAGPAKAAASQKPKVVLGTVRGDIHDIGKDIVGFMLDVNGFEVDDLGVDVPEEKFVEAVKKDKAQIVALSGFLTLAYDSMKSTVEALKKAGVRDNVKIMIGGGQITEMVKDYVNADAYGMDAVAAVRLAKQWAGAK
ncbi:MAG: cobalamin B12-binding domain-containing protein [Chloroflexi bacterium]|nr:cobalamin B12-binding domain-containing protein [Chloroflexota bacterium]